ncbi:MAG: DUF4249 domain-containing protein [Ginsengibacter sp.]
MKKNLSLKIIIGILISLALAHCKVPYVPPLKPTSTNLLVVEGFIDGAAPVSFTLSRTRTLSGGDTAARKYELNAKVLIEDDHQNSYPLTEAGNGIYNSPNILSLNTTYKYRLHIFTANSEEYLSDLVAFKQSPPIDSINWNFKGNGVQVYVNTHDPNNLTKYYRWEYTETWEFHSYYSSNFQYDAVTNTVISRVVPIHICWQTDVSTNIFLGSSSNLSNAVNYEMPLAYIEQHDNKISVLYSILVKQYPLDVKGYNYWLAMKNNTENIGSIFDPQPNETAGNIHCVSNPAESVVGYVNAGNSFIERSYINNNLMPADWNLIPYCPQIVVPNIPDSLKFYFSSLFVPIDAAGPPAFPPAAYSASEPDCVDCTINGTNVKPSFWP